jgi:geranylgeranyl pyrophosphate synthase
MTAHLDLIPPLESVRSHLEQVQALLVASVADVEEPVCSLLRHALGGGKRLRGAVVILVGQLMACSPAPFLTLAAAIEMLHAATLVHDDVVDTSGLRRGHRTLNSVFPAGVAVLTGDCLLAISTSLVAELNHPRLLQVFARALRAICAGEVWQSLITKGAHRHQEDYYRSIEAKSAALFAAATEMAGIAAGAQEPHVAALRAYGRELGLAFQIVDDVLDLTGTEPRLGKIPGSDLRQGVITLPTLYYLENAGNSSPVHTVLGGARDDEHVQAAIQAICESGAIQAALSHAREHAGSAQQALAQLPDRPAKLALHHLADFVVDRRH